MAPSPLTARQPSPTEAAATIGAVIIGAGPSGLAVGACLRRANVDFVILERADTLAPAWRRHYDSLRLHTPREYSGLPHRPWPRQAPRYPTRDQFLAYLEDYARHFQLEPHFGHEAVSVVPEGGCWRVETTRGAFRARHVVLTGGLCADPALPDLPGLPAFPGTVLHSSRFRTGLPFRGARVLVLGGGNSGQDITLDLLAHGATVAWSVRGRSNVIPRDVLGQPSVRVSASLRFLPPRVADALTFPLRWALYHDLHRYGLRPLSCGPIQQLSQGRGVPLIDLGIARALRTGRVRLYPDVHHVEGTDVVFATGERLTVDAVVLATGYRPAELPGLDVMSRTPNVHRCGYTPSRIGLLYEIGREARRVAAQIRIDVSPFASPSSRTRSSGQQTAVRSRA